MKKIKIRFQRFVFGEGWQWYAGGEGYVIAETERFYKVKVGFLRKEWVEKIRSEIINY